MMHKVETQRIWIGLGLLLIATIVFALPERTFDPIAILLTMGAAVYLWRSLDNELTTWQPPQPIVQNPYRWWHGISILIGIFCLVLLTERNTPLLGIEWIASFHHDVQIALLFLGVICLAWGAGSGKSPVTYVRRLISPEHRTEFAIVLLILAIGFALRIIGLETSIRVMVDEMNTVVEMNFFDDHVVNILHPITPKISPYTWVLAWIRYQSVLLFGHTFTSMRLVSAIMGTIALSILYILGRTLFDRRVAIVAVLILVTLPTHLHMTRLALPNVMDNVFGALVLTHIVLGLRFGRRMDFAIAGVSLGLTQYFYEGGRLFFFPLVFLWILAGVIFWRGWLRHRWRALLLTAVLAIMVSLPFHITWWTIDETISPRLETVGVGRAYWNAVLTSDVGEGWLTIIADQIARAFLVMISMPEQSVFYGGDMPFIMPLLLPFFLLGSMICAKNWRTPMVVLPIWVISTAMANGLLITNSAILTHFVVVLPALALITGLGIVRGWEFLRRLPVVKIIPQYAIWLVVGIMMLAQMHYYFNIHTPHFLTEYHAARPYPDIDDAMLRAAQLPDDMLIQVIPQYRVDSYYLRTLLLYLDRRDNVEVLHTYDLTEASIDALPDDRPIAFFIGREDIRTPFLLSRRFDLSEPLYTDNPIIPVEKQFAIYLYRP